MNRHQRRQAQANKGRELRHPQPAGSIQRSGHEPATSPPSGVLQGKASELSNHGCELMERGRLVEAESKFRRALELRPRFADVLSNLACVALRRRRWNEAEDFARRALEIDSRHVDALINLASVLQSTGRLTQAAESLERAVGIAPNNPAVWSSLGNVRFAKWELSEAARCFKEALTLDPDNAEAYAGLAPVLLSHGQWDEGMAALLHALRANPQNTDALMNLGTALSRENKAGEARDAYRRVLASEPAPGAAALRLAMTVPVVPESVDEIERSRAEALSVLKEMRLQDVKVTDPLRQVNFVNFYSGYHALNEAEVNGELAAAHLRACPALDWTAPHCRSWKKPERLRLGIMTAFSETHIVGELFRAIARLFDRELFEIVALYSPRSEHAPSTPAPEAERAVKLPPALFEARELIARERLDALFYLDIMMDPFAYLMSFARLAPVQCTTWGHPVTTGVPNIDYFISAEDWESEDADSHYTERLVRMKELPMYFAEPPVPYAPAERERLGFPPDIRLYACPQSLFKLHPDFDQALGELLRRDPKGVVTLLTGERPNWNIAYSRRLKKKFPDVLERLMFLPRLSRLDYLMLLKSADAVLDPFHWGGGNTTIEALACGVPVPTLPGAYLRGRLTLGFYRKMGTPELIASSPENYVDLNYRIANDRDFRASLMSKVEDRLPGLFENTRAIRELERFFISAAQAKSSNEG